MGSGSEANIFIKVLGWGTIILFLIGIFYTFFIYEEPETEPLDPATYKRLEDAYNRGELERPMREGDPYR